MSGDINIDCFICPEERDGYARGFLATVQAHIIQLKTDVKHLTSYMNVLPTTVPFESSMEKYTGDVLQSIKLCSKQCFSQNKTHRNIVQGCAFHVKMCYMEGTFSTCIFLICLST